MWILFNEEGNVETSIPHGQAIRQYNPFDLYLCFPKEGKFLNVNPVAHFSNGGSFVIAGNQDDDIWGTYITFEQAYVDEAVFGFVPGKTYICYHIHVLEDSGVTEKFGKLTMVVALTLGETSHQAKTVLSVAETFGSHTSLSVSQSEFDKLLAIIRSNCAVYTFPMTDGPTGVSYPVAVALYGWSGLGFVNGAVAFASTVAEYDDWTTIASCSDSAAKLTANTTFFSKDQDGNDVEFRLLVDSGVVYLQIHAGAYAGKTISFSGVCAIDTPDRLDISNDGGTTVYTIVNVSATVAYDSTLASGECHVTTSYTDASTTDTSLKNVILAFSFPSPVKGDKGDKGDKGNPGITVSSSGMFGFSVNSSGHLILSYSGSVAPAITIDSSGHLIYTY